MSDSDFMQPASRPAEVVPQVRFHPMRRAKVYMITLRSARAASRSQMFLHAHAPHGQIVVIFVAQSDWHASDVAVRAFNPE
jgi:hypothetical protein